MSITPTSESEPTIFFERVPLDVFAGIRVVDRTKILADIMRFISDASKEKAVAYLNCIGDTLVRHKAQLPGEVKGKLFKMLNTDLTLLKKVGIFIVAGLLKNGFTEEHQKEANRELVSRIIEIIRSRDALDYLGAGPLQAYLISIFQIAGGKAESKKEVQKHSSLYSKTGMNELMEVLDKK